ncbi:MAG: hypothetical protein HY721_08610 [Planctomycetes bacterium]|nr:hypothetical protein [Planctomycetota bacterium]
MKPSIRASHDSAWKDILEAYFPQFLAFFFPQIHRDIDWSRGFRFLATQLRKLLPEGDARKGDVDTLVQLWVRGGGEAWVLIHVEIQGYRQKGFPWRITRYNSRIVAGKGREVITLVVLTDEHPSFRPSFYEFVQWEFRRRLEFPTVKLLDYKGECGRLERERNPFAFVVLAHLRAQAAKTPDARRTAKVRLVRDLLARGWNRLAIISLLKFIDWIIRLPPELEQEARRDIAEIEKETTVPYVTSWERMAEEKGLRQGLIEAIELGLKLRFGATAMRVRMRIRRLQDLKRLQRLKAEVVTAKGLKEFETLVGTQ